MEYIKKDKARNTTFDKLKKGLKKKAQELATLCDVPLCVLIYQGPNSEVDTFPANGDLVRSVIDRYASVPREENSKRSLNLQDVLDSRKKKKAAAGDDQQQQLSKLQNNNNNNNNGPYNSYPSWMPDLNGCTKEELLRLADVLDYKMQAVEERIGNMRGDFGNYGGGNGNGNAIVTTNGGGDVQIGGYENGMHWPMGVWQASGGGGDGSSSGGSITMAPCTYYDPNNMYYGQVGPHGVLAENTSTGGSGVVAQPMYGGSVRFEPHQMGGGQYKFR